MKRKEKAMEYFTDGYNCSQSVAMAFSDDMGMNPKTVARMISAFGGGMGRLREVCGSVSGMFFVLGTLCGYDDPKEPKAKKQLYEMVQELACRFEQENNSIICRQLLGLEQKRDIPIPEKRTQEYYEKRPCKELVGCAAEILELFLIEQQFVKAE